MLGFCAKREAHHIYYKNKLKDAGSFGSIRHHILLRPYMLTNDFPYKPFCYYTLVSSPISRPPYTEIRTIYALPFGDPNCRNCDDKINPGQAHAVRTSTSCSLVGTPYCMQTILSVSNRFVTHFFGPIYEGAHHICSAIQRTYKAIFARWNKNRGYTTERPGGHRGSHPFSLTWPNRRYNSSYGTPYRPCNHNPLAAGSYPPRKHRPQFPHRKAHSVSAFP